MSHVCVVCVWCVRSASISSLVLWDGNLGFWVTLSTLLYSYFLYVSNLMYEKVFLQPYFRGNLEVKQAYTP